MARRSASAALFPVARYTIPSATSWEARILIFILAQNTHIRIGFVGLVSRSSKLYHSVDPGLVQVKPCTEGVRIIDVKIQILPIGRQKAIMRDNVDVEISQTHTAPCSLRACTDYPPARCRCTGVQSIITECEAIAFAIAEIVGDVAYKWNIAIEAFSSRTLCSAPRSGHALVRRAAEAYWQRTFSRACGDADLAARGVAAELAEVITFTVET
ncbi:uncharacterized protein LAESUDRAFT_765575 [Laetiporus sulphureus 93-53]|uniref:Uncharacterized protein n=1 Tax=Laetiporus sulphureus 93-53 TaxID=1314785 RepID=A0A165APD4_9APHY|nr:uncharacterized protein LAESUDRAFT_765575 [Laetiporus sulphureus 93-53]KZS99401.1 hypothetical protein LAESUDRAFT_765575 [Laetiporus sulphureus 93-53]